LCARLWSNWLTEFPSKDCDNKWSYKPWHCCQACGDGENWRNFTFRDGRCVYAGTRRDVPYENVPDSTVYPSAKTWRQCCYYCGDTAGEYVHVQNGENQFCGLRYPMVQSAANQETETTSSLSAPPDTPIKKLDAFVAAYKESRNIDELMSLEDRTRHLIKTHCNDNDFIRHVVYHVFGIGHPDQPIVASSGQETWLSSLDAVRNIFTCTLCNVGVNGLQVTKVVPLLPFRRSGMGRRFIYLPREPFNHIAGIAGRRFNSCRCSCHRCVC
jgi:hypothetical protein